MFQIRLATPDDLHVILDLIDEAAEWLRTKDTDQWARPWPDRAERDARVLRGLLACRTWLVEDYGIPVATVTYRPDSYSGLWTATEQLVPAGYMSRLVVSRKYAGYGIGAALTDWAGARARDEFGAEYLRIDVWTTNVRLHSYYEGRGFHFQRFCDDAAYPSSALFHKRTADISPAALSRFAEIRAIPAAPASSGAPMAVRNAGSRARGQDSAHPAPRQAQCTHKASSAKASSAKASSAARRRRRSRRLASGMVRLAGLAPLVTLAHMGLRRAQTPLH
jgi:ribosomal protein S18 acetylase RimI-like enzyme